MNLLPHSEAFMLYQFMVSFHSRMDGNVPEGATIFIGDSITQSLCTSAVVPVSVNYGIGGDTTTGVLQRLKVYPSLQKAGAVILAVGINDFKYKITNEEMIANYTNIIKQLSSSAPIIISAVLPIDDEVREERRGWNQRITAFNQDLKTLALKSKNVSFMDTGRLLMDANGNLADKYHDGDGIHLNANGNAVWIAELRKTIKNAQQNVAGN